MKRAYRGAKTEKRLPTRKRRGLRMFFDWIKSRMLLTVTLLRTVPAVGKQRNTKRRRPHRFGKLRYESLEQRQLLSIVPPAPDNPNARYVNAVYVDVLGRTADQDGVDYWSGKLNGGAGREAVAALLVHSDEYYANQIIAPAYAKYLHRSSDGSGLAFWVDQMQHNGLSDESLEAHFIGSPEFYVNAGNTDPQWVDALYQAFLGREADSQGRVFWVEQLRSGETRDQVALGFAASVERERLRISDDYLHYLGREPDQQGIDFWVAQFTNGMSNEDLITDFVAADEYYGEHANPVNAAPSFSAGDPPAANEDSGTHTITGWAAFNPGPGVNEAGQTATYTVSNVSNAGLFTAAPAVALDGTLTYTLAPDVSGISTFDVQVQDSGGTANGGIDSSATQSFAIRVDFVNDAPTFTASDPPAVNEDSGAQTMTGWAAFNPGPGANEAGQTATYTVGNVSNGSLFTVPPAVAPNGTLTYTLAPDVSGISTFDVQVQDSGGSANGGTNSSAAQIFTITVSFVNDAPSFTASDPPAVNEDSGAQTITGWAAFNAGPGDNEAGQTATYTVSNVSNRSLFTAQPAMSPNGTLTYMLAADVSGTSTFDVQVQDSGGTANGGVDTSATQSFTITVNFVNDAPSFTASDPPAVNEDSGAQAVTGWAAFTSGAGANEAGQTATYTVSDVSNGSLFSVAPAVAPDGTLTYTLAADASGTSTFDVQVQDSGGTANGGIDTSATQSFTITVNFVNDAPSFTASDPPAVNEDSGAQAVTGWAAFTSGPGANEAGQTATYTVSDVSNAGLFSVAPAVAPDGTLTYTLAADASGTSTFDVQVQDSGGTANGGIDTSLTQSFTITVNFVNDAPSFTASDPPAVNEDFGAQTITGWAAFNAGPGANEAGQTATYSISNVSNAGLFSVAPAVAPNGTLTYTLAPNISGTSTFDVLVQDSGGTANGGVDTSAAQSFTITVNFVNDAPSFTASDPPAVNEDSGAQTITGWAAFNAGPGANEAGQTAAYSISNVSNAGLFSVAPAVAPNGTFTYTLAPNISGTSTFDVQVQDSGGTANGGVDTSATQTFTITVLSVNDPPVRTSATAADVAVDADRANTSAVSLNLSNLDYAPGPATATDETNQTVTYTITAVPAFVHLYQMDGTSPVFAGTTLSGLDELRGLTYETVLDAAGGPDVLSWTAQDDGGTANGGIDTLTESLTVTVFPTVDPDYFSQRLANNDAANPLPNAGFAFDWSKYNASAGSSADDAIFEFTSWYAGKPGTGALSFTTLPQAPTDALSELATRVSAGLATLDSDIGDIASTFEGQQNTLDGLSTYTILREKLVEQATLELLSQDLTTLQGALEEEQGRIASARDTALHSLTPVPAPAADSASTQEQLAAAHSQEEVLLANLGTLAVAQQTEQDLTSSAKFQAAASDASSAGQDVQTLFDSTRVALTTVQSQEAGLQDIIDHPLDHLTWPPASGLGFAAGMISGSFSRFSVAADEQTIASIESGSVVIRDSRSGDVLESLSVSGTLLSVASTADGKVWTLTRDDSTVALRDPASGQVLWQWQDVDHPFTFMAATRDGSLVAVVRYNTISTLRRDGDTVTRRDFTLTDSIQSDLHFDPTGTFLAVPMQSTLVLLNVDTGDTYNFTGFRDWVSATAWSPDGTMLAAGDSKGFVQIVDLPTKQEIGSFQMPYNYYVGSLAFSPSQALLLTGDANVGLMFWDITHPDQIKEYARSTGETDLFFFQTSLTGNTVLARNSHGLIAYSMPDAGRGAPISRISPPILNPVTPTPPATPDHPAWSQSGKITGSLGTVVANRFSSVSPDGQDFLIADGSTVQVMAIASAQVTQTFTFGGDILAAAYTSDQQKLVLAADDDVANTSSLTVRDASTQAVLLNKSFPALIKGVSINAAHTLSAVADQAGASLVTIVDLATGTTESIPGTEDHSEAVAISESGRYVAVGTNNGTVVVYDHTTKQSHTLTGMHREIKVLDWSHGTDGLLAAADDNANLALYAPTSPQALSVFSSPYDSDSTTGLLFSQNNLLLFRGANANGLITFDVSNAGSPAVSSQVPLLALNAARNLTLSQTDQTFFLSAYNSTGTGSTFITGVTIPAYGRGPATAVVPPMSTTPPTVAPLNSDQQNELAAPTTVASLNDTQQQYLLDSVTAYFNERVTEGGMPGVPSFYLQQMESNPALLNLSTDSSYRDFYSHIVADMQSKWPLQNPPHLAALAGGSGNYVPPVDPVTPPPPSPVQVQQRQAAEELVLQNLRSPVRLSAGQWIVVVNPHSTTHVGAEKNAVDLNLTTNGTDTNPQLDRGQPVYAPAGGIIIAIDVDAGSLIIRSLTTEADGTIVPYFNHFEHLDLTDAALYQGLTINAGTYVGSISDHVTLDAEPITPHLHWSVHLFSPDGASSDLSQWLADHGIRQIISDDGTDTGGGQLINWQIPDPGTIGFEATRPVDTALPIYRVTFTLSEASMVNLSLTDNANGNLRLTSSDGRVDFLSNHPTYGDLGITVAQSVSTTLPPGDYTIQVERAEPISSIEGTINATHAYLNVALEPFNTSRLTGVITIDGHADPTTVSLSGFGGVDSMNRRIDTTINRNQRAWVIVHGRGDSENSDQMMELTESIYAYASTHGEQVLAVDWHEGASDNPPGSLGLGGASWISRVGKWVSDQLVNLGILADEVNLVGHSWGTFVSFEIAENLGQVNAIVALDPAKNIPGANTYDTTKVNFSYVSHTSVSFHSSVFGFAYVAKSAVFSFDVGNGAVQILNPISSHNASVDAFANIVRSGLTYSSDPLAEHFALGAIDSGTEMSDVQFQPGFSGHIDLGYIPVNGQWQPVPMRVTFTDRTTDALLSITELGLLDVSAPLAYSNELPKLQGHETITFEMPTSGHARVSLINKSVNNNVLTLVVSVEAGPVTLSANPGETVSSILALARGVATFSLSTDPNSFEKDYLLRIEYLP
jgi:pimeloyl-ACP methyl ester carboxylesterase